ncbi:MAG: hypothetical protein ACE5HE_04770 [Phycisphaerae bacterium]
MSRRTVDRGWSLTLALRWVARRAGGRIDLDDLHAALGLPMLVCAVPREPDLSLWVTYARDAFLDRTAHSFGLVVRAVHPPDAACGLESAEGFQQHFDASYRPLIETALDNNQPVLAWRGWNADREGLWGVITRKCDEGAGFAGSVFGLDPDEPECKGVALASPPVQVYFVERITQAAPAAEERLTQALEHAVGALNNTQGKRFGAITGPAAFDAWIDRLEPRTVTGNASAISGITVAARAHQSLAVSTVTSHQDMLSFLQRHFDYAKPDQLPRVEALMSTCTRLIDALAELTDPGIIRELMQTSAGLSELSNHLVRARTACAEASHG